MVTPFGSTGTAAGLVLAMRLLRWPTTVVGVRVAPAVVANRWRAGHLGRAAERLLRRIAIVVPRSTAAAPLLILNRLGRGYGHPTPAGDQATCVAARHGIVLDPTYGAKGFAAVTEVRQRGYRRIVFWHTFAPPDSAETDR